MQVLASTFIYNNFDTPAITYNTVPDGIKQPDIKKAYHCW
jgi:hypothetical protein